MKNLDGIPVYSLSIKEVDDEYGVSVISLVESPAIGKTFLALAQHEKKQVKLSLDEDRHIATGIALRANYPIYRRDEYTGKEYYFEVSPEQMEMIVQKFMREGRNMSVNIEHSHESFVDDCVLFESFIFTDAHKTIYPEFDDIESGSWFVSYKINNPKVWKLIKEGKLKGFSVELVGDLNEIDEDFEDMTEEEREEYDELKQILTLINKLN